MTLTQQLEDKKKGCGVEIVKEQSYISEYGKFKTAKVICGKVYDRDLILCPKCQEIIAILEQAIAEIDDLCNKLFEKDLLLQKQRQKEIEFLKEIYNKPYVPTLTEKIKKRMEYLDEKD